MKNKIIKFIANVVGTALGLVAGIGLIALILLVSDRIQHACPDVAIYVYCLGD